MMSIVMALIPSRRFGSPYERGVLASAALVIFAVVITIADASRRIQQPITMTNGPILYYIHDPNHLDTDKELATGHLLTGRKHLKVAFGLRVRKTDILHQ